LLLFYILYTTTMYQRFPWMAVFNLKLLLFYILYTTTTYKRLPSMTATNAEFEALVLSWENLDEAKMQILTQRVELMAAEEAAEKLAAEKLAAEKLAAEEDATIEVGTRVTVEGFSDKPGDAIVTKIWKDRSVSVEYDDGSTWSHVWMSPRDRDIYIDEKYKSLEEKCNVLVKENINKQDKINAVKKWLDIYDINITYAMGKELINILTD
jgi:Neuraminidase (sialidase)